MSARDLAAVVAGCVAVPVGFTRSVAIVCAAAQAPGATPARAASWTRTLGPGMGSTGIGLSPPAGAHRLVHAGLALPGTIAGAAAPSVQHYRSRRRTPAAPP